MSEEEKRKKIHEMHASCKDYFIRQYMDPDNGAMTDWKLQVLQDLADGKKPPQIPHYDDVQDLYPAEEEPLNLDVHF